MPSHRGDLTGLSVCRTTRPDAKWDWISGLCELIGLMFTILRLLITALSQSQLVSCNLSFLSGAGFLAHYQSPGACKGDAFTFIWANAQGAHLCLRHCAECNLEAMRSFLRQHNIKVKSVSCTWRTGPSSGSAFSHQIISGSLTALLKIQFPCLEIGDNNSDYLRGVFGGIN